jgi:hypothetical protein
MAATHEPFHLHKRSLVQQKIMDAPTSLISITVWFDEAFKYDDGVKF